MIIPFFKIIPIDIKIKFFAIKPKNVIKSATGYISPSSSINLTLYFACFLVHTFFSKIQISTHLFLIKNIQKRGFKNPKKKAFF